MLFSDPESGILYNDCCLGLTQRDCYELPWTRLDYSDFVVLTVSITAGIPIWVKNKAINNGESWWFQRQLLKILSCMCQKIFIEMMTYYQRKYFKCHDYCFGNSLIIDAKRGETQITSIVVQTPKQLPL